MINIIAVSIYGSGVQIIAPKLKDFCASPFPGPSFCYAYVDLDEDTDIELFRSFVDFLEKKKEELDLQYKIFYKAQMEADSRVRNVKDKNLLKSGYFKFLPPSHRAFNPCNTSTICDSYFTHPVDEEHKKRKLRLASPGDFDFDFDGFLYSYFSVVKKIQQSKLTGIAFHGVRSNDQDLWIYGAYNFFTSGIFHDEIKKWHEITANEFGCDLDKESSLFLLTKEQEEQGLGKKVFNRLVEDLRKRGFDGPEGYIYVYAPPSSGSKWFLVDIKQVQDVESSQTQYTTKNRTCPHCYTVYPLLTSLLSLKKSSIPDMDFFRTENNHLIISKRVYDFFQKEKILPMESYCEPVILV